MQRTVLALLLAFTLAPVVSAADKAGSAPSSPLIIAKGKMLNQTTPTSIAVFTPKFTGLYRLSVYASVVTADPSSRAFWFACPTWTDDGGQNTNQYMLEGYGSLPGSFYTEVSTQAGVAFPLEVKAGTPITLNVTQSNGPDNSAYSVYYTLERLE